MPVLIRTGISAGYLRDISGTSPGYPPVYTGFGLLQLRDNQVKRQVRGNNEQEYPLQASEGREPVNRINWLPPGAKNPVAKAARMDG